MSILCRLLGSWASCNPPHLHVKLTSVLIQLSTQLTSRLSLPQPHLPPPGKPCPAPEPSWASPYLLQRCPPHPSCVALSLGPGVGRSDLSSWVITHPQPCPVLLTGYMLAWLANILSQDICTCCLKGLCFVHGRLLTPSSQGQPLLNPQCKGAKSDIPTVTVF